MQKNVTGQQSTGLVLRWLPGFIKRYIPDSLKWGFTHDWTTICEDCEGWHAIFCPISFEAHECGPLCKVKHLSYALTIMNCTLGIQLEYPRTHAIQPL